MTCQPQLLDYCKARDAGDFERAAVLEGAVLEQNLGLARTCAKRVGGYNEDAVQAASLGLLDSIRTYDEAREATLATHAWRRMVGELAASAAAEAAVTVPPKTYRKAKTLAADAERAGEPIEETAARVGASPAVVAATKLRRSYSAASERDSFDLESDVIEADQESALTAALRCWRGSDNEDRAARGADRLAAGGLWPVAADERLETLARLDAALWVVEREYPIDVDVWRRHFLDGEQWTSIAADYEVSRQRVAKRARNREAALGRALAELGEVPRDALQLWAERPVVFEALEYLGLADDGLGPLELWYLAEDLEVAVEEIGALEGAAWRARHLDGLTWAEIGALLGVSHQIATAAGRRADAALVALLSPGSDADGPNEVAVVEPEQLLLVSVEPVEPVEQFLPFAAPTQAQPSTPLTWWTPISTTRPRFRGRVPARAPRVSWGTRQVEFPWSRTASSSTRARVLAVHCNGPPAGARAPPSVAARAA